jgi:peptidoglycan hydrolase-like protein with peptidoglycan-binding domain
VTHVKAPLLALGVAVATCLLASPALAQSTPAPAAPGKPAFKVSGGLATKKMRYFAPSQQVVVRGRVNDFPVANEVLTLYAIRGKKASKTVRRRVKSDGRFEFRFKVGNAGSLRLVIKHKASAAQDAFRSKSKAITVVNWSAGVGERGTKVMLLQRQLLRQGYATPVTGYFDDATGRAVFTFKKANGLGLDAGGYASTDVYSKLLRNQGAFKLRYPKAGKGGKHVEFDWSRQVLVLAKGGKPYRSYHASSGKPSTPTVFGSFRFYRKSPGTNSHGMVYSSYFIGGYAIHGYVDVPNYPASHGCLRVPIPNAIQIYNQIDLGEPIFVYE